MEVRDLSCINTFIRTLLENACVTKVNFVHSTPLQTAQTGCFCAHGRVFSQIYLPFQFWLVLRPCKYETLVMGDLHKSIFIFLPYSCVSQGFKPNNTQTKLKLIGVRSSGTEASMDWAEGCHRWVWGKRESVLVSRKANKMLH